MSELLMHPMGGGTGSDDLTATAANVLSGKTAVTSDSDDEAITGTMPNNGAMNVTLTPGGSGSTSLGVAAGYYSGGTITANGSAAYSAGHSQGVTDADNRVNTSSASYNSGYAKGKSDGEAAAVFGIQVYYTAKKGAVPWGGWQGGQTYYISKNTVIGSQVAYINDESGEYGIRVKINRIS